MLFCSNVNSPPPSVMTDDDEYKMLAIHNMLFCSNVNSPSPTVMTDDDEWNNSVNVSNLQHAILQQCELTFLPTVMTDDDEWSNSVNVSNLQHAILQMCKFIFPLMRLTMTTQINYVMIMHCMVTFPYDSDNNNSIHVDEASGHAWVIIVGGARYGIRNMLYSTAIWVYPPPKNDDWWWLLK